MKNQYTNELWGWPQLLANGCWLLLGRLGSCMKNVSGLSIWRKKGKHLPISAYASLFKVLPQKCTSLHFKVRQCAGPTWLRESPGQILEAPAKVWGMAVRQGPVRLYLQEGTCSESVSMAGIRDRGHPKVRGGTKRCPMHTPHLMLDSAFKTPSYRELCGVEQIAYP